VVKAERRNKKVTWQDYEALRDNMKLPLRMGVEHLPTQECAQARKALTTPAFAGHGQYGGY